LAINGKKMLFAPSWCHANQLNLDLLIERTDSDKPCKLEIKYNLPSHWLILFVYRWFLSGTVFF